MKKGFAVLTTILMVAVLAISVGTMVVVLNDKDTTNGGVNNSGSNSGEVNHTHTLVQQYDDTGHWKKCSSCNKNFEKYKHEFGDWVIDVLPTDTTSGKKHRSCECGYVEEVEIMPLLTEITKAVGLNLNYVDRVLSANVGSTIESFDLTNRVELSNGFSWRLFSDFACENEITNKVMPLNRGVNNAYILTEKNGVVNRYRVSIYRKNTVDYYFKYDDKYISHSAVEEGTYLEDKHLVPQKEGYTFDYWMVDGVQVEFPYLINKEVIFEANFKPNTYTINYVLDGGINNVNNPTKYTVEEEKMLYEPTKEGYNFAGWYDSIDFLHRVDYVNGYGNKTLYAKFVNYTEGIDYELHGEEYSVKRFNGSLSGIVYIDSTYQMKPVTRIDYEAFRNSNVKKVVIPSSIKFIGERAFVGCMELQEVELNEGLINIEANAFEGTKIRKIVLPNTIDYIGSNAFMNCKNLEEIVFGSHLSRIGGSAFMGCEKLTEINMPKTVREIGASAFKDCYNVMQINIPYVREIMPNTFENCRGVVELTIPDSVENIGVKAFNGCGSLRLLNISDGVKTIERNAFMNCQELYRINLPSTLVKAEGSFNNCNIVEIVQLYLRDFTIDRLFAKSDDYGYISEVKVPDTLRMIKILGGEYLPREFAKNAVGLKTIVIPEFITEIGCSAFSGCTSLEEINIPNSVNKLEDSIFSGCTNLKVVRLSKSISSIPASTFSDCSSLGFVPIPENIVRIENSAFAGCNLHKLILPSKLNFIGDFAFNNSINNLGNDYLIIPKSVVNIGHNVFYSDNYNQDIKYFIESPEYLPGWDRDVFSNGKIILYETDVNKDPYSTWHYDTDGKTPIYNGQRYPIY